MCWSPTRFYSRRAVCGLQIFAVGEVVSRRTGSVVAYPCRLWCLGALVGQFRSTVGISATRLVAFSTYKFNPALFKSEHTVTSEAYKTVLGGAATIKTQARSRLHRVYAPFSSCWLRTPRRRRSRRSTRLQMLGPAPSFEARHVLSHPPLFRLAWCFAGPQYTVLDPQPRQLRL